MPRLRVEFTTVHDRYLLKYLAVYCPTKDGRSGRKVYHDLVAPENRDKWPWAVHHTEQSWRERYVKNAASFDQKILLYQRKNVVKSAETRKRAAEPLQKEVKRPKYEEEEEEEEEETPSSNTPAAVQRENANPPRSPSTAKSPSKRPPEPSEMQVPKSTPSTSVCPKPAPSGQPHEPLEVPLQALKSTQSTSARPEPREPPETPLQAPKSTPPTNTRPAPVPTPQPNDDASMSPTKKPTLETPGRRASSRSPPRHVKRTKVRLDKSPDVFASEPSTPMAGTSVPVSIDDPSSQTRLPAATPVQPRAPPRIVGSFHGQVLVDRQGHVPLALPRAETPVAEEEEVVVEMEVEEGEEEEEKQQEDDIQWPPVRGRTAKLKRASAPDLGVDAHHAFSQPQPEAAPGSKEGRERTRADERRAVAEQFAVPRPVESDRREDVVQNGSSPAKRVVTTAPPSDPFSDHAPHPFSKPFKFPAPRPSMRSPFQPKSPTKETRRPPRPPPATKAARHPALARARRQTLKNGNVRERERRRDVPSVDLVTLSRSSPSTRSHSRSSTSTSLTVRPQQQSLPAFAQGTPRVLDDVASDSDVWHGHVPALSFVGTSTPARSIAGPNAGTMSLSNTPHWSPLSLIRRPHPPDVLFTVSQGLATILAHMSANHGLAVGVVEAVYARVGSLRETDEVLKGMREAAEGFGEREIERRVRARRGGGHASALARRNGVGMGRGRANGHGWKALRYVVASEGEYSPPETSRAAMWKRQSESSQVEEGDEEEGREVEEELLDSDEGSLAGEHDRNEDAPRHAWSMTALLEDTRLVQTLEASLGKEQFRMDVARMFRS